MKNVIKRLGFMLCTAAMFFCFGACGKHQDTSHGVNDADGVITENYTLSGLPDLSEEDLISKPDSNEISDEAGLTSNSAGVAALSEAKRMKEQNRARNKETLLEIINSEGLTDAQKQEAVDTMVKMTAIAEKEAAAEILLEAKGFTDVVVSINDNAVDVAINMAVLDDAMRAQIEDIVKRKTEIPASNITISNYYLSGLPDLSEEDLISKPDSNEISDEAVLTSNSAGVAALSEAKRMKEQNRARDKETLLEIINGEGLTDAQKQEAVDTMVQMTAIAEKEAAAEILLEAKGFTDVVVSINDNAVDVAINVAVLDDAMRAQIEDIVKRKTEIPASNITITNYYYDVVP